MASRLIAFCTSGLALLAAHAETPAAATPPPPVDVAFDLRYRYEGVDQTGTTESADANTLRLRARLVTRESAGFSGFLELDHVQGIGAERYNDTRNGLTEYPVVADPEGTDLNQAWLQYAARPDTRLRLGRQRVNFDNQRFIGSVEWRQNEQTLDAIRIETTAFRGLALNYAYVDRVNRVFGPDAGTPPATLDGSSHLLNAKLSPFAAGSIVAYAYLLDFDESSQLSSRTIGARYEGSRDVRNGVSLGWAVEYARQRDAGDNPLDVNASYAQLELRLRVAEADFNVGREILSGEDGGVDPASSRAFQTPLATLHRWQGWADKFLTTPPAGIRDTYVGGTFHRGRWRVQAVWHDFTADATSLRYGTEIDALAALTFGKGPELLVKYADYRADGQFTDTRKLWAQISYSF